MHDVHYISLEYEYLRETGWTTSQVLQLLVLIAILRTPLHLGSSFAEEFLKNIFM